jgi:glycosyltransferase involved in cell wall biosynthesis
MIVLESLAVGTPVLVMPSCGLAETLRKFQENYVAKSESFNGLAESFSSLIDKNETMESRQEIREFCSNNFGIIKVTESLIATYLEVLSDDC